MNLIDTHCHLQDKRIYSNLDAVMDRAYAAGVTGFLCCGSEIEDWDAVKEISQRFEGVVPAYGIHPWFVDKAEGLWLNTQLRFLEQPGSVLGEIGLDTKFARTPIDLQLTIFDQQLNLARELERPVSIHCVKAWHLMIPFLKKYHHPGVPIQIHSYNGGAELVDQLLELNVFFSFSGSLTRSRNNKAHRAIRKIPLDRLLIETDAPDIPPEKDGIIDFDSPNEPATLPLIMNKVAELLDINHGDLVRQLEKNSAAFFKKR